MYQPKLTIMETEDAIKQIKDAFEKALSEALNVRRVSAPLFVETASGLNDQLNGIEKPLNFPYHNERVEVVQSLAKWKRNALYEYGFHIGEGLYTDMNAIRPSETLDATHSLYVDQWDWEKVIDEKDRNIDTLKWHVNKIYGALLTLETLVNKTYPIYQKKLPETIYFIDTQTLLNRYPNATPSKREALITKAKKAVFIMKIGDALSDGSVHDSRSPDYDDWTLNGDLMVWHAPLKEALELSSMGIRVNQEALSSQLNKTPNWATGDFHESLRKNVLPQSIGGGIGQSRLCQFLLEKYHVGEVQASYWPKAIKAYCKTNHIPLL